MVRWCMPASESTEMAQRTVEVEGRAEGSSPEETLTGQTRLGLVTTSTEIRPIRKLRLEGDLESSVLCDLE